MDSVKANLTTELTEMFTRERLENNAYFVNRMKMSLGIPLNAVLNERRVKSLCGDHGVVKEVLQSLSNATYSEKDQMVTPLITPRLIIVLITHPDEQAVLRAAQPHLQDKQYKLMMNKLVFEKEEDAQALIKAMNGVEVEGQKVVLSLEEECVYLSLYNKVHEQKSQVQPNMDANQMMMMNMMFMNPFLMMPFMQGGDQAMMNQMNQFQKNKFFIRKSADPAPENIPQQQSIIEEKITIQKKEPRKSKVEPEKRESIRSSKGGKIVYYDTKKEDNEEQNNIEIPMELGEEKQVKVQYGIQEMVRIFQGLPKEQLNYSSSLDAFKEDGIVNDQFQTLESVQPSPITEEMKKMMLTSYQNTPVTGPRPAPEIIS